MTPRAWAAAALLALAACGDGADDGEAAGPRSAELPAVEFTVDLGQRAGVVPLLSCAGDGHCAAVAATWPGLRGTCAAGGYCAAEAIVEAPAAVDVGADARDLRGALAADVGYRVDARAAGADLRATLALGPGRVAIAELAPAAAGLRGPERRAAVAASAELGAAVGGPSLRLVLVARAAAGAGEPLPSGRAAVRCAVRLTETP